MKTRAFIPLVALLLVAGIANAATAGDEQSRKEAQQKLAAAHERLEKAAQEVAELSSRIAVDGAPDKFMFVGRGGNRAMLGIAIGRGESAEADGVRVLSVSPGGPAAGAGIKAGDLLTELNGTSLKGDKDADANDKLFEIMSKVKPGNDVNVSYRRDGKVSATKIKAENLPRTATMPLRFERRIVRGDHPDFDEQQFDIIRGPRSMHMGSLGAIELVPLSPKLGQYFGTEKGLLVVRVPDDKELKLEDGDVLLDIDGRVPSNPGHAFRILGSYQSGEKVTLNVLRQRKKMSVAITVPEPQRFGPQPPLPPRAAHPASSPTPPVPPPPAPGAIT
jgi:S1-C subfamily serine protease